MSAIGVGECSVCGEERTSAWAAYGCGGVCLRCAVDAVQRLTGVAGLVGWMPDAADSMVSAMEYMLDWCVSVDGPQANGDHELIDVERVGNTADLVLAPWSAGHAHGHHTAIVRANAATHLLIVP